MLRHLACLTAATATVGLLAAGRQAAAARAAAQLACSRSLTAEQRTQVIDAQALAASSVAAAAAARGALRGSRQEKPRVWLERQGHAGETSQGPGHQLASSRPARARASSSQGPDLQALNPSMLLPPGDDQPRANCGPNPTQRHRSLMDGATGHHLPEQHRGRAGTMRACHQHACAFTLGASAANVGKAGGDRLAGNWMGQAIAPVCPARTPLRCCHWVGTFRGCSGSMCRRPHFPSTPNPPCAPPPVCHCTPPLCHCTPRAALHAEACAQCAHGTHMGVPVGERRFSAHDVVPDGLPTVQCLMDCPRCRLEARQP